MLHKLSPLFFVLMILFSFSIYGAFEFETSAEYGFLFNGNDHSGGIKLGGDYFFEKSAVGFSADTLFYKINDDSINENPLFIHMSFAPHYKYKFYDKYTIYLGPGYEWVRYKIFKVFQNDKRFIGLIGSQILFPEAIKKHTFYLGIEFVSSLNFKLNGSKLTLNAGLIF